MSSLRNFAGVIVEGFSKDRGVELPIALNFKRGSHKEARDIADSCPSKAP